MNRRRFLQVLTSLLGLSALGTFLYPLLRLLSPIPAAVKGKINIVMAKAEIPAGAAKDFLIGDTPAIIINEGDKGFHVFSRVCTHLGCLVKYDPQKRELICPCHGGTFDLNGNVIAGPPPKPLETFPVSVAGDKIMIG